MTKDREFLTILNAAEHACGVLDDITNTAVSVTIYRLASVAASMLTITMAKMPEFNTAGTNIVSKLREISDQLLATEQCIDARFDSEDDGGGADPYVFLAMELCRQAAEGLSQAAHEAEERMRVSAYGRAPATANDNDQHRGRSNAWMQGFADGQKETWSEHLADEEDPVGDDYLSGWMAGHKQAKRA